MITNRLKDLKLLILDIDGVLTDGRIVYNDNGVETKAFDVKDGLGIRLLIDAGIHICIVTGRRSNALRHRCKDLGIDQLFEGVSDKTTVFDIILNRTGISAEQAAFIGDDLPDLPLMKSVGLGIAVADAHEFVRQNADLITSSGGGQGAVREVSEMILKAQGLWESILERFL